MSENLYDIANKAIEFIKVGEFVAAENLINNSLVKYPDNNNLLLILSGIYAQTARDKLAVEILEKLISENYTHQTVFDNLYNLYLYQQNYSLALATLQNKLIVHGENQNLLIEILKLAKHNGKLILAAKVCRRLIAMNPEDGDLYSTLGIIYSELSILEIAAQAMYEAYRLMPNSVNSYNNLAVASYEAKKHNNAVYYLRKGIEKFPADLRLRTTELLFSHTACYWEQMPEYFEALKAQIFLLDKLIQDKNFKLNPTNRANLNIGKAGLFDAFCFLFPTNTYPQLQKTVGRVLASEWGEYFDNPVGYLQENQKLAQNINVTKKLRIAYVSADFRKHATMFLLTEIFEKHNKENFEIYAYSLAADDFSIYSQRLKQSLNCFRQVDQLNDRQIAEQIKNDRIDILIDLKGYTRFGRGGIFALRPAPVIVNWLGYPATMGDPRMADYIIGDPVVTPINHSIDFSEKIAQMPVCYQANDRKRPFPATDSRSKHCLPENDFILCSFNNSTKLNTYWLSVWGEILKQIPFASLYLMDTSIDVNEKLANFFTNMGIDKNRIHFAYSIDLAEHFARLACADLALDTFPCNSHTTASDALWMGVPIVTKIGNSFAGRVAASTLNAVGLNDLITYNDYDYINKVVELANNREKLQRYRQHLRDTRLSCALFDSSRFTQDLEDLYQKMWKNHLNGKHDHIVATKQ